MAPRLWRTASSALNKIVATFPPEVSELLERMALDREISHRTFQNVRGLIRDILNRYTDGTSALILNLSFYAARQHRERSTIASIV